MKTLMQVGLKMLFIHTLCTVLKRTQDEDCNAGWPEDVVSTQSLHSVKGDPRRSP